MCVVWKGVCTHGSDMTGAEIVTAAPLVTHIIPLHNWEYNTVVALTIGRFSLSEKSLDYRKSR